MTTDLIERAQAGDEAAFSALMELHRRELQVHCYRMLGSLQDAEDVLQETLLAAWQGFSEFEGRSSVRTWLYRIATNRCLNARRSRSRRPRMTTPPFDVEPPEPTRLGEVMWLEPFPDRLLEGAAEEALGPEALYESRESMSLAFITALQQLAPLQRAVLVLRDVLGYHASEVATILETSEASVTSALKRARLNTQRRLPIDQAPPPAPNSPAEIEVVERLTRAYELGDLEAVVALLTDDVWLTMPPVPLEYQGRALAEQFLRTIAFRPGRKFRLVPTRANCQPAFGFYVQDPGSGLFHALGVLVVTLAGNQISAVARFENSVLPRFGLPRSLTD